MRDPHLTITKTKRAGGTVRWWFTLVIPATQEAEIRRIEVPSQSQANSL
jgi:hypothetical protein